MSGHSKWSQIKRKKGAEDQKRSKIFSMLVKTINVEMKRANGDRSSANVRKAIERAKAANMPNDNIERAIKNAAGNTGSAMEEVTYEAYGPGGAALIIEGITDNRNRTSQEIKFILSKNNSSLAAPGAASWAFTRTPEGVWQPNNLMELSETDAQALANLIDTLEENEDVKKVYDNAGLSD
jgi:YebC/PmpR family DNA-binding regulatory protein